MDLRMSMVLGRRVGGYSQSSFSGLHMLQTGLSHPSAASFHEKGADILRIRMLTPRGGE